MLLPYFRSIFYTDVLPMLLCDDESRRVRAYWAHQRHLRLDLYAAMDRHDLPAVLELVSRQALEESPKADPEYHI